MRIKLLFLISILFCTGSYAQETVTEPDFIGEVLVLNPDNSTTPLEKATVKIKTKANASIYLVGMGKVKTKINVDGPSAQVRLHQGDDFKLIVRAVDNNTDPMSIINIFQFETGKKVRKAELSSLSTFGGASSNNLELLPYTAKKYGESSYLITLKEKPVGEYGITVRNPNSLDEKNIIVASFGIDQINTYSRIAITANVNVSKLVFTIDYTDLHKTILNLLITNNIYLCKSV